ncbi:MAG: hypothetical protein Q7U78_09060 [Gallionella sp.]|nr:hypothetical protein [Gallionella sp.]
MKPVVTNVGIRIGRFRLPGMARFTRRKHWLAHHGICRIAAQARLRVIARAGDTEGWSTALFVLPGVDGQVRIGNLDTMRIKSLL